eukprot:scaffold11731_cov119-Isochrysis_galbana.AAC.10
MYRTFEDIRSGFIGNNCEQRRLSRVSPTCDDVPLPTARPPSFPPTSSSLSPRAEVSRLLPSPGCVSELWEYALYGGAQLAPHRLYMCLQDSSRPRPKSEKGMYEKAPAQWSTSLGTRAFPAPLCLPCLVATCLGSVLVFVLRELDPPLPPRKGDYRVGAQTTTNHM